MQKSPFLDCRVYRHRFFGVVALPLAPASSHSHGIRSGAQPATRQTTLLPTYRLQVGVETPRYTKLQQPTKITQTRRKTIRFKNGFLEIHRQVPVNAAAAKHPVIYRRHRQVHVNLTTAENLRSPAASPCDPPEATSEYHPARKRQIPLDQSSKGEYQPFLAGSNWRFLPVMPKPRNLVATPKTAKKPTACNQGMSIGSLPSMCPTNIDQPQHCMK